MRHLSVAIVFGSLFFFTVGCESKPANNANNSTDSKAGSPAPGEHVHAHASEGPHHGTLVELGSEEYHVEVTHDASTVTLYVLDSSAKQAVPIDASDVTINVVHDGRPEQFKLTASPDAGDPAGKSSRFTLADAELVGHLDEESAAPKLSLTIDGTPYRGEIEHEHEGHDHSDHAH
ncbi:MAG: hypothetical protein ABI557_05795 [Aureliella sp.]